MINLLENLLNVLGIFSYNIKNCLDESFSIGNEVTKSQQISSSSIIARDNNFDSFHKKYFLNCKQQISYIKQL